MPSLTVNLTDLNAATKSFKGMYSVSGVSDFAPSIAIKWTDLVAAVETNGGIANIQEIALRFIHRYDKTSQVWFLTMEVCQMDMTTGALVAYGNRYDLMNNTITTSSFTGNYDPVYFDYVLFDGKGIDPNTFVHNVVFPWYQEISEIHCQNNLPLTDTHSAAVFTACTFDYSAEVPAKCLVDWPHTIVVYMAAEGHGIYVDDAEYTHMFTNRAGDVGSMCPPRCNVYDWPAALPVVATCR